jgi:Ras-related protein Rab-8A
VIQHADVHVNKILIGNKCDMDDQRVVSFEEGKQLANEYGIQFFETSAKNDMNVEKGFTTVAREVKDRLIADGPGRQLQGQKLQGAPKEKRSCC